MYIYTSVNFLACMREYMSTRAVVKSCILRSLLFVGTNFRELGMQRILILAS